VRRRGLQHVTKHGIRQAHVETVPGARALTLSLSLNWGLPFHVPSPLVGMAWRPDLRRFRAGRREFAMLANEGGPSLIGRRHNSYNGFQRLDCFTLSPRLGKV
jgi:hypothetical protein